MRLLGLDIGSSSIKAGILIAGRVDGGIARGVKRVPFPTHYGDDRAQVNADDILRGVAKAIRSLGAKARSVDAIAFSVMAPSWLAMDSRGRAITPIVTHQDRRSVEIAREIERRVGRKRHLHLAGNRPFPGGISSTTAAWFAKHEKSTMRRADLVGHLNTFLLRQLTGARVTDPSNASFMGLYRTLTRGGWSEELCDAAEISASQLPEVRESHEIGGDVSRAAAHTFGLREGTPVLVGMMDTGAALLLRGAKVGQLINVCGTTDVLGLCTDAPRPHERLLTRAVGTGKRWMSVGTLAAAGSALQWAHQTFFPEMSDERFYRLLGRVRAGAANATHKCASAARADDSRTVTFDPYLAGERTSIEQRRAAFAGLTLSTTREQMLDAIADALASASAARLDLLRDANNTRISRDVLVSGGATALADLLHRDWRGQWTFHHEREATLRGLARLGEIAEVAR